MGLHFSPEVTIGNLVATSTFIISAFLAWRDLNWRVKNLEIWKIEHLHTAEEAMRNISMLRESVVKLTQIADDSRYRLEMLEERHHQKGRMQ